MSLVGAAAAVGGLLLVMSLASGLIARLPLTTFALYLVTGLAVGPWGLGWLDVDFLADRIWLQPLTTVALVVSLFVSGLRLRLPLQDRRWRQALMLAFPAMLLCVAGVAAVGWLLFGLSWPLAIVLGATLAPTDPVLASIVAVSHSSDHDPLRFILSAEAGLNDGSALPLLLLGLWLDHHAPAAAPLLRWALLDVLYAVPMGLALGFAMGWIAGYLDTKLKLRFADTAPSDFLALALMALSYAAAEAAHASGFLAAFAAGLGLRAIEVYVVRRHPNPELGGRHPSDDHPPAESMVNPTRIDEDDRNEPAVMVGKVLSDVLSFGHTASRLLGAALVLLLGVAMAHHLDRRGWLLAALLFVLIRPLSVLATTAFSATPLRFRLLEGWLGVRGIGSLNYLALALGTQLGGPASRELAGLVITTTVASVAVHGFSAQLLLGRRRHRAAPRQA